MKKLLLALLFVAPPSFFAQNTGIATVTLGSNQYEISRIRVNGVWRNACCVDLPPNDGCEDDCGSQGIAPITDPLPFENYPNFFNNPPNLNLGGGNSAWVFKDDVFLTGTLIEGSLEFTYLTSFPNYDVVNECSSCDFIAFEMDNETTIIINKASYFQRKASPQETNFFENLDSQLEENYSLNVYPVPYKSGQELNIECKKEILKLTLINKSNGSLINLVYHSTSNYLYSTIIGSDLVASGNYLLQAEIEGNITLKQNLTILK